MKALNLHLSFFLMHHFVCCMYTIFNTVHNMSDINNIHQFQDIWRIFKRVWARTDRQTECINTFQLCWKVLKTEKKGWIFLRFEKLVSYFLLYKKFMWIKINKYHSINGNTLLDTFWRLLQFVFSNNRLKPTIIVLIFPLLLEC